MEKRPPPSPLVSSPYSKRAEIRDRWVAFCPSLPRASFSLANIIRVQRTKERPGPRNRAMWLPFGGIFFFFSLSRKKNFSMFRRHDFIGVVERSREFVCKRFWRWRIERNERKLMKKMRWEMKWKKGNWICRIDSKIILGIFRISRIWVCLRVVSMRFLRARRIDGDGPRRELVSTIPFPRWIFIRVYTGLIRGFVAS